MANWFRYPNGMFRTKIGIHDEIDDNIVEIIYYSEVRVHFRSDKI